MHQLRQAAVVLPGTCQNAGRRIHHTLLCVGDDLRSPGKNDITVIHTWRGQVSPQILSKALFRRKMHAKALGDASRFSVNSSGNKNNKAGVACNL